MGSPQKTKLKWRKMKKIILKLKKGLEKRMKSILLRFQPLKRESSQIRDVLCLSRASRMIGIKKNIT